MFIAEVELFLVSLFTDFLKSVHVELADERAHGVLVKYVRKNICGESLWVFNGESEVVLAPAYDGRVRVALDY